MTIASFIDLVNGTLPSAPASGSVRLTTSTNKALVTTDEAGLTLTAPTIRENETLAVRPQNNSGTSASPTGNVSTTAKMMGLGLVAGFTATPQVTGRFAVWIAGMALNSTAAGDGTSITGKYGTGTAPANAAADTGTAFGLQQHFIASTTAGQQGFMCMGVVSGLTLNTAVWFDLSVVAVTGGGSTVKDVQIILFEF